MEILIDGVLQSVGELSAHFGVPDLDGELRTSQEILDCIADPSNAGKSFYLRGGEYEAMDFTGLRPSSLITFKVFPREQAIFADLRFDYTTNLRFDGNDVNTERDGVGGYPDDQFGLWLRGSGVTGSDLPPVPACVVFANGSATQWTENIQFANVRVGSATSETKEDWACQHGIIFSAFTRDILFEDFQFAYIAGDLPDFNPATGAGDFEAGGFALWWFGTDPDNWGDFTFRRGRFCHTMNDFVQFGPKSPVSLTLFEDCLFEELYNYGDAHADMLQNYGGTGQLTVRNSVYRRGTDWLLHGGNPGGTRLFENVLFGEYPPGPVNLNRINLSKDDEAGATDYEFRNCTITVPLTTDSTVGPTYTSNMVVSNCIWQGTQTGTGLDPDLIFTDDGLPNLVIPSDRFGVIPGLAGDTSDGGTAVFNDEMECTNFSQGYRKSETFPWSLA